MTLKAIETAYNGYLFRSRLEARWAVFFDALGVRYTYEAEGYDLGDGLYYLPDFWLPHMQSYVEVKPQTAGRHEVELARLLAASSGKNVVILSGSPGVPRLDQRFGEYVEESDYWATVLYGNFDSDYGADGFCEYHFESLSEFLKTKGVSAPDYDGTIECARELIELDEAWYFCEHGREHPYWYFGPYENNLLWHAPGTDNLTLRTRLDYGAWSCSPPLIYAYSLARQARFEHGQTPHVQPYMKTMRTAEVSR